uniref:F-box domain-containing protein n=1 Tax=Aegilops tauschii subsp. strangulata TaxID=200361 RepID=A0A453RYU3_AEGTS
MGSRAGGTETAEERTRVCDLPEACVAHVIALTSPRDACRCAAVSPCFRDAAGSDVVWARFLPPDYLQLHQAPARRFPLSRSASTASAAASASSTKKEAYLGLTDAALLVDGGGMAVWLAKESGAKCVAISARRLSLPWEDGEFSWRWTPHPLSRYAHHFFFVLVINFSFLLTPNQTTQLPALITL